MLNETECLRTNLAGRGRIDVEDMVSGKLQNSNSTRIHLGIERDCPDIIKTKTVKPKMILLHNP